MDEARELLKHGRYDVNCKGAYRRTPLHSACISGHMDMVRMLISEFQADTTLQDKWGDTPLHEAAWNGRGELALTLITVMQTYQIMLALLDYTEHVNMEMLVW